MRRSLICLIFLVAAVGCDGQTILKGVVVGPDDKPVAGAKVQLFDPNHTQAGVHDSTTEESGEYTVGMVHAPFDILLVITVTKDGYMPYRKEFKASQQESLKKITLETDPNAPAKKD